MSHAQCRKYVERKITLDGLLGYIVKATPQHHALARLTGTLPLNFISTLVRNKSLPSSHNIIRGDHLRVIPLLLTLQMRNGTNLVVLPAAALAVRAVAQRAPLSSPSVTPLGARGVHRRIDKAQSRNTLPPPTAPHWKGQGVTLVT
jgi:hypothetical protein